MNTYRFSRKRDKQISLAVTFHGEEAARASLQGGGDLRSILYRPLDGDWQAKHSWTGDTAIRHGLDHFETLDPNLAAQARNAYERLREQEPRPAPVGLTDHDIRTALKASTSLSLREEVGLCAHQARADVAHVSTDRLSVWEIKSDRDTLGRLASQVQVYNGVCDTVHLVTTPHHLKKALEVIPPWWGVILAHDVNGAVALQEVRPGNQNPSLDPYLLASLLWADEAREVLTRHGHGRGVSRMTRHQLWERLGAVLEPATLRSEVRAAMAARTSR